MIVDFILGVKVKFIEPEDEFSCKTTIIINSEAKDED